MARIAETAVRAAGGIRRRFHHKEPEMGLLDGLLGGGARRGGGMSPLTMALLGLLAYKALRGKNLSDMFGNAGARGGAGGGLGGLLQGGLGGLLGGGILSGGLSDLLKQFQNNGQGEKAASWVASGPNKPIRPDELEAALGEERISWLMQQTGLSRDELLQGLSRELPSAIDELTPAGRLPSENDSPQIAPSTVRPN
jgi:uncharacterized protein YidB (DUF937 family)